MAANPTLRSFSSVGGNVLPQSVVQRAFAGMHGRPLNYNQLADAMKKLTQWYEDNGVLGSVRGWVAGGWVGAARKVLVGWESFP